MGTTTNFWSGKRVFLTGHTGFKGSWLALWLEHLGARIQGYALAPPTSPSLFDLAKIDGSVHSTISDVRDGVRVADELIKFKPDVILHLAAQSVVLRSYDDPVETYGTNVIGTVNVLDAVRRLDRRCAVINVTTDKVYENRQWLWGYRENDRLGGRDPYSSSKACAELVSRAFGESFFKDSRSTEHAVGLANARAGNVIGGGDWTPHQLVPDVIQSFAAGRPVVLRHPRAVRPWQHVLDCLSGYLTLAEMLYALPDRFSGDWNFGPSDADAQPVAAIVETLARQWGGEQRWTTDPVPHAHEEMELRLNSQKARRELNWMPHLPLDEALAWTTEWYRRHRDGEAARDLCREQIERYTGLKHVNRS